MTYRVIIRMIINLKRSVIVRRTAVLLTIVTKIVVFTFVIVRMTAVLRTIVTKIVVFTFVIVRRTAVLHLTAGG